ncbi:MAG: threonine ammonia-lyase, partial [SAR202 cluster bacterium]|nr:threonine ammonia-lyase [SAR202 cluster bacterium]
HTLAEGAGATALAGAVRYPEKVKGKKVAITISGGNITSEQLRQSLNVYEG